MGRRLCRRPRQAPPKESFARKKEADRFAATAHLEVREGTHVADSTSATIRQAGELWISAIERAGRERSTVEQYRGHLDHHLFPMVGNVRLTTFGVPDARKLEEDLLDAGRSAAMTRKVMVSLGSLLTDAQERGLVSRNVVRDMRKRRGSADARAEKRAKGKLRVGVDIPTPDEVRAFLGGLERPVAAPAADSGIHRPAGQRVARAAVVRCRPRARDAARPPASRSIQRHREAEVRGRRAGGAIAADRREHAARVETGLPEGRARPRIPDRLRARCNRSPTYSSEPLRHQ